MTKHVAKTFKSREMTQKYAMRLCYALNDRKNAYRINNVDYTVCSRSALHTVSKELYAIGYRITTFKNLGWTVDPHLKEARFYTKVGHDPLLVRETSTQWGVIITLLGESLPTFSAALIALSSVITEQCVVTVMHPVEGTSGLALQCKIQKHMVIAKSRVESDSGSGDMLKQPTIHDVLLGKGFVCKGSMYISMALGVLASVVGNTIIIVDTPWA